MANTARNKPGEEKITVVEGPNALENISSKYESNKKIINTVLTVVLVAVVGYFAYQKLYNEPREQKAATAMSHPQNAFEVDSMKKALDGDGQHPGFLKIQKKYSGTKAANLCNYYIGVAYLKTGEAKKAIKFLEDFDGKGTTVSHAANGSLGDAYMETGNIKKGIEYYNKATDNKTDEALNPIYLYRAGLAYEMDNKPEEAKKVYIRVRDEYPQSMQARDVDRNLGRLGILD
jgi:tetratricopeptide (TPR) repeat protein